MKQSSLSIRPGNIPVGVVGLGLMGSSVATCVLAAGHPVAAVEIDATRRRSARRKILNYLREMKREGLLRGDVREVIGRLNVFEDYAGLETCELVVECVFEDVELKKVVLGKVEAAISSGSIIGTNTSGIPVTDLQKGARHPQRILGIHWAEPAHITRFMEIICGEQTDRKYADHAAALSRRWGKEPSIVTRDIRGLLLIAACMPCCGRHFIWSKRASLQSLTWIAR